MPVRDRSPFLHQKWGKKWKRRRKETQAHDQLTEAGPNEIEGKKTNPFQKVLNSIWGPIRG